MNMLYELRLGHNTMEATKNICYVKDEGPIDHNTVTRSVEKFCLGCKNFNDQTRLDQAKTVNSETVLGQSSELHSSLASHSPVWFVTFCYLGNAK